MNKIDQKSLMEMYDYAINENFDTLYEKSTEASDQISGYGKMYFDDIIDDYSNELADELMPLITKDEYGVSIDGFEQEVLFKEACHKAVEDIVVSMVGKCE